MTDSVDGRVPSGSDELPLPHPSASEGASRIGRTGRLRGVEVQRHPARRFRLRLPRSGIIAYLAIMGPGLIAANAGNDAGGIATYASAGAVYRYSMLWALLVTCISLIVVQEMCARMGAFTGKGLSDLIRENFSLRATTIAMVGLLVANTGITVSEFLGIAASAQIIGIPAWIAVPPIALLLWYLVTQQGTATSEKLFLGLSLLFLVYIPAAFHNTNWHDVLHDTVLPHVSLSGAYIGTVVALIGTTISPYMQFYVQSAVRDKGVAPAAYRFTRVEVVSGSIFAIAVAGFIIVATGSALCHPSGCPIGNASISQPQDFAFALRSVAGDMSERLFALGLFGASMLAAAVLPLSTAYAVCETFGLESGTEKSFPEAPVFNGIFTGMIAVSTLIAVIPNLPIVQVLLSLQKLNAIVLPLILWYILKLINRVDLMGEHCNGRVYNFIAYASMIILTVLSALYLMGQVGFGPAAS